MSSNSARPLPTRIEDLVIYELHANGLGVDRGADHGTLEDAVRLIPYLRDLGVNCVELMPMSEFQERGGWGYSTSHYFAIEYADGGRDQFKHFVREWVRAWLHDMADRVASDDQRGCPLANAAVELPEKDHPARRVIEAFKTAQRERLVQLCAAARLEEPELLADELFLMLEGARVTAQSMGTKGLGDRLIRMGERVSGPNLPACSGRRACAEASPTAGKWRPMPGWRRRPGRAARSIASKVCRRPAIRGCGRR